MPKTEMTTEARNALISAAILAHVRAGRTMPDAFDAVLGAGAYDRLAEQVWTRLRAA